MQTYSTEEIAHLVGWPPGRERTHARDGLLAATRRGRAYRFDFRDLALLKTAKALSDQGVSLTRVRRSLKRLKRSLPDGRPLTALRVRSLGGEVVVEDRGALWEVESGQGQLVLEATSPEPSVRYLEGAAGELDRLFERAMMLEDEDVAAAVQVYRRILDTDPGQMETHINLGRLFQAEHRLEAAAEHYARVLEDETYGAIAAFNLGTVMEDLGRTDRAIELYLRAVRGGVIDAHYNVARLYELKGERAEALKHLIELTRNPVR